MLNPDHPALLRLRDHQNGQPPQQVVPGFAAVDHYDGLLGSSERATWGGPIPWERGTGVTRAKSLDESIKKLSTTLHKHFVHAFERGEYAVNGRVTEDGHVALLVLLRNPDEDQGGVPPKRVRTPGILVPPRLALAGGDIRRIHDELVKRGRGFAQYDAWHIGTPGKEGSLCPAMPNDGNSWGFSHPSYWHENSSFCRECYDLAIKEGLFRTRATSFEEEDEPSGTF